MAVKIGIFDSGIGGFTVVSEIMKLLPAQPLIYFGDTARTPYGTKSLETLVRYAVEDVQFLLNHGASIIVVACHSAASAATSVLKRKFSVPIFEVSLPAAELAIRVTKRKKIGFIGTRATVSSGVYEREIRERMPDADVYGQACPLLVPLVEEGWLRARETRMIVKKYLRPLKLSGIDTLILGCTHYPLLKGLIREKMGKRVKIIDPSEAVAGEIFSYMQATGQLARDENPGNYRFFVSDSTPATEEVVQRFMGRRIHLEKVSLA